MLISFSGEYGSNLHESDHTATDYDQCSAIGDKVLYHGGNSVDSAVASALCMALVAPHLTGLGGGGVMMVHEHRKNKTVVIDFRETAPEGARNGRFVEGKSSWWFRGR